MLGNVVLIAAVILPQLYASFIPGAIHYMCGTM